MSVVCTSFEECNIVDNLAKTRVSPAIAGWTDTSKLILKLFF